MSFTLHQGTTPLIISIPHAGVEIPAAFAGLFRADWLARRDADWHIPALYGFARELGASVISARVSRSVIDLNRDPEGGSLYPGQATTGLCPVETFDGEPLYDGAGPDAAETARRVAEYFWPYHQALSAEIARVKAAHGFAVLYDAHSIRSRIPRLFAGELPHFNIGTHDGRACPPAMTAKVAEICAASGFSFVVNGRFKGGWITRHYGQPEARVYALQMELAMRGYMDEPEIPTPLNWPGAMKNPAPVAATLKQILEGLRHDPLG
ncbi:N-formylglutamate deformylase [Acidocella sp.]|uniref:N-formylglutamate deformylase n=1 Tax=Acidocella sp. TaxID=50710 RepID=UPI002619DDF7|nr:N-formylglutamate deformylase [Acidocella sp.]